MTGKTLTLAAIIGSLLIGTSASVVLARQDMGRGPGGEGMFVRMLQEFDTNKDGKISKEESTTARDKMFATIDADNDGVLIPGEFRKHREAMRAARQAEMQANAPAPDGQAQGNGPAAGQGQGQGQGAGQGQGPQDGTGPMNGQQPRDGMGNQFGWGPDGDRGPGGDDCDGPRQGKGHGWGDDDDQRHGRHHGMRDGNRGPGMERGGPMGDRMGAMGPRGMMGMADTDENGQISKDEAAAVADKMFTQMDTDKDGAITVDDFPKRGFWMQ
ncbi:calcium-binding protein [Rhizobium sp. KAs_5_22]|uniref:EF-hand domain-containing protein n=1 Tax=Ciceribacter selenitireducens TaxID=448181 RepID=UPI00048CF6DB|nr:EF-hand domain-containing protein [Ciceribacter selenitireducens]PPJ47996.1 calcium-binding protein [Rhizobium sp. KAs_5_22]